MATRNVLVTPRGRAIYPHLTTPDTKFNADGVYSVKLSVPTVAAEKLIAQLDELQKQAVLEAQKENPKKKIKEADLPYSTNPENDDETVFTFKMKARIKGKDGEVINMRPAIFDAKGKACPRDIKIGGGSILRVSFEPVKFYTATVGAGVSLRLKAVQVLELREFGGGSAESYGFEAEEGFSAEGMSESEGATSETTESEAAEETTTIDGSDF